MSQLRMYWLPGTPVKTFELPEGYSISNYKEESDKLAWVECCKNGLCGPDAGPEAFDGSITSIETLDPYKDVFFIDYQGEHVGTVTAFLQYEGGDLVGDMHMVSIRTDFRGKGLAKYLTMITLLHLKDVPGLKFINLTTDDWRRAAIKGYLDGGFVPVDCDEYMRERWQAILNDPSYKREELQLINHDLSKSVLLKKTSVRGKIIAIGGGFDGADAWDLAERVVHLSGKLHPNYLYIPTTGFDMGGAGPMGMYSQMGCHVESLLVTAPYVTEALIAEKIRNADLIHVPGGNLQFCMDTWRNTNTVTYLREAFEQGKILFGWSSGAMCWFNKGFDDCGRRDEFRFVPGCNLIPYCNVPHYETPFWQGFNRYAKEAGVSTIACENNTALCYLDGKYSVTVAAGRPDARVWFFDKENNYERVDLTAHPEILEKL